MHRSHRIALVIPAYREEKLIKPTLDAVPPLIDVIYVVDDHSPDNQNAVIAACAARDKRIHLLEHPKNQGPGAAIITGYRKSSEDGNDITVVVGGDNQMSLHEIERFLDPLIDGKADYAKGNRFLMSQFDDTLAKMPMARLIGNWMITAVTKIASGFYKTMDVVDGYTAITKRAIDAINWKKAWPGYGYPMDFLIRLNGYGFKLIEVPRTAVYTPGERQSQIKGPRYFSRVAPMLLRGFLWRLRFKYMYRDFHPLMFFFIMGFVLLPLGLLLSIDLTVKWLITEGFVITGSRSILAALLIITGLQFLLFAMLFDMEEGK